MPVSENYIEDLIATKAETFCSESGITSVPKVVEINSEIENATKSMDGLDPDQGSGSDRSISKDENGKNIITYGVCSECGKPLEKPTKAGSMVYKIADHFVVQWENMKQFYPNAEYGGWIF